MYGWLVSFLSAFVQLAIAVDVLGILPLYLTMIETVPAENKRGVLKASLVTAFLVGLLFLLLGKAVFKALGISMGDFEIAGGLILILIGTIDLVGEEKTLRTPMEAIGSVPIGVPLIVGPAVISILLLLVDHRGIVMTLAAFVANIVVVGVIFSHADAVNRVFGKNGVKAASRIMMLLLIAFGVKMLRLGLISAFHLR